MKIKTVIGITLLAAFALFGVISFAQKSSAQTNTDSAAQSSTPNSTMGQQGTMYGHMMNGSSMSGGMMNGRMMYGNHMYGQGMMGRNMMGNYSATQKLINRLESDLSAAKAQAGSAARSKLDDASSLVGKLKNQLSNSWGMMMSYMPMHGGSGCYWNQTGQQTQQRQ